LRVFQAYDLEQWDTKIQRNKKKILTGLFCISLMGENVSGNCRGIKGKPTTLVKIT
jgi:hypothetical protein